MENPATWGPLEKAIDQGLRQAREERTQGLVGHSEVRIVADAVREVIEPAAHAASFALSEVRRLQGLISREVTHR